jgi:lipopolysaccharide export system permease protein
MGSIGRYIFRTTFGAFLLVLVSVTALMWITQALHDIDLVTNQGQSIWVFVALTALIIPLLVLIIAPLAFMVAMAYVLNKLSTDSELIVMNAAGMPPWRLFRPFLAVGLIVSILVGAIAAYLSPRSLRELTAWVTEIRTDLVTRIVQPGRFTPLAGGSLILHIREREPNGQLLGIFIDDQRDPKERLTIVAEEGNILKNDRGTFLVLATGNIQRYQASDRDPNIVRFDRYAFDLSQLAPETGAQKFSARERYLWELFDVKADDPTLIDQPEQMRAELHDRITAPLFPLAIAVLTFACLGAPRTNRQGRAVSLLSAIGAVTLLRGLGFAGTLAGAHTPAALLVPYAALTTAFVFGCRGISRGVPLEPPTLLVDGAARLMDRLARIRTRPAESVEAVEPRA